MLRQSKDKRLTLITCYPIYYIGPAPDRLVVVAKLRGPAGENSAVARSENASTPADARTSKQ